MRAPVRKPAHRFRPDIEGIRAVAVLAVALWHADVPGIPGGFTGVDFFFVLSGYLITGLLLTEHETRSTISLVNFYARRARRLIPAAVLVISMTLLASVLVLGPRGLAVAGGSGRAAAIYLSNIWFSRDSSNYFAQTGATSPFVHTWSLAVEEQFYLVWPILILVSLRIHSSRRILIGAVAAVSLVSFTACLLLSYKDPQAAFYYSPLRAWQFGIGALAVMLPRDCIRKLSPAGGLLGWLGLIGMVACVALLNHRFYPGWRGLLPAVSTAVLLVSAPPRLLFARPLQWLGGLSYSWYLWHWPMLTLAAAAIPGITAAGKIAVLAASLIVAALTHHFVENPIRFNRFLSDRPVLTVAFALALSGVGFGFGTQVRYFSDELASDPRLAPFVSAARDDARPSRGCFTEAGRSELTPCATGSGAARRHIVLFGDSHAMHWFPPIEKIAISRGWKLTPITKPGCPSTDARRDFSFSEDSCIAWRAKAFEWITNTRPDLVVIANIYPTADPRGLNAQSTAVDVYRKGIRKTLIRLAQAGISVMLIRDSPHQHFDIPNCLARAVRTGFFPREACRMLAAEALHASFYEADRTASADLPNVHLVDLSSEYCPGDYCDVQRGGLILYRDHQHFTRRYALTLAPLIEPQLQRAMSP